MILDHVAYRADALVKVPASLHAEILRHRDLHTLDKVAVPERFDKRVRKAEDEQVVHRPLTQVVVDSKDRLLVEAAMKDLIEPSRRCEIPPKRFFEDDARATIASRRRQLLHDHFEHRRR